MRMCLIWGAPRSGTSWLGHLVAQHPDVEYRFQPIHSYTFRPRLEHNASLVDLYWFYWRLLCTRDPYVLNGLAGDVKLQDKKLLSRIFPRALVFKETHDLLSIHRILRLDSKARLAVLIRDPISVVESWINAPKEFNPDWSVSDEWMAASKKNSEYSGNHFGVDQWIKTTKQTLTLSSELPQQLRIVRYDRLYKSTEETIAEVLNHFCLPLDRYSLLPLSPIPEKLDEYSVSRRRKKSPSWKRLPNDLRREIERVIRKEGLGDFLTQR